MENKYMNQLWVAYYHGSIEIKGGKANAFLRR